jgi:putative ATP-dependent endonuclease of OLD family
MFLSELRIWNFRKYGSGDDGASGLHLQLNKGLNLLVGENDSGKTARAK